MNITVTKWIRAALLPLALFSTPVLAEPLWIAGVGVGLHHNEIENDSVNPLNLFLSLALAVNDHIEVGAEVSTTLADDDIGATDVEADTAFVFIRGKLTLDNGTVLYAQVGSSSLELTQTTGATVSDSDDTDTGFGIGARFSVGHDSAVNVEYISYFEDDEFDGVAGDASHGSLNVGYVSYF